MHSLGPSQIGREGMDVELTEEGNGGGASVQIRRGRRRFGAPDKCMGFAERGGRGVSELRCRAQPWNKREQQRASAAFDQKEKGNGGRGRHHAEEGGGAVWSSAMLREGERSPTPGSCAGAAETGAGQAVSSTVRKQGSGRWAWAARKCVGRPREGNELGRF
jgi:hypothetical protein